MFALLAAILLFFVAIGVDNIIGGEVSLVYLALCLWALHFAFALPVWPRR